MGRYRLVMARIEAGHQQIHFAVPVHVLSGEAAEVLEGHAATGVTSDLDCLGVSEAGIGFWREPAMVTRWK